MRSVRWLLGPIIVLVWAGGCAPAAAPPASTPAASPPGGAAPAATAAALPAEVAARLDSIARAAVSNGVTPGLSVAVAQGDRILFARGYGLADVERGDSVREETVFRSGSVTKQFTAAAILRLAEQGRLSLDDEITRFLPDFPTQGHRVTVRHLLNHTSGIRSYTSLGPRWAVRMGEDLAPEELIALFRDEPFDFAPGERFLYNNSGYFLLGMIIEQVTGQAYAEYVERELLHPLGLTGITYCPNEPAAGHAHGYQPAAGGHAPSPPISMTHPYAAGALCATASDLVRWNHALVSGRVVRPESYRRMTTPDTLTSGEATAYGFGLGLGSLEGVRLVSHTGGIPGFSAVLSYFPERDLSIAVLTNNQAANAGMLGARMSRVVLDLSQPEVRDLALDAAERARYSGTYDLGLLQLRVFEEGDRLMAQGTNQPSFRLLAQGEHEFRAAFDPTVRLVFRVEGERAESLTLHQGGAVIEGRRID